MNNEIFTFGSNLSGIHGAGSAKAAFEKYGAVWGCGVGHHGKSYAIPTKNENLNVLSLAEIANYVNVFFEYASREPELSFRIVNIGCGLAGYLPHEIAPLFRGAGSNCLFTPEFEKILG